MRSAKSWFNWTLFQKNMTRFWPIWGLYLVIWLFVFPINLILNDIDLRWFAHQQVLTLIRSLGLPLAAVFSLLAACAVWSYLYNNRSACLMHSLPIRREGLFLTNFLSGMTFLAGPNLIVFLLTLLAEAARGTVDAGSLTMWFFSVSLMELAFFCFATFCAMFTGHILGLPAFYAILNVLAAGLVWLLDLTLSRFVFGYTGIEGLWRAAEWLTPAWKLMDYLEVRHIAARDTYQFVGLGYILIYVFFGLVLAAVALAVYRRRDMERAGDVVTVSPMRPVFQYGVAFCCALAFGSLLYEIFRGSLPEGAWTLLVFMLLCGGLGYFIARMLLEKSFRVFRYWKGCVPFLAALVVLVCVMEFDLTGFERRVPDEDDVASVQIWSMNTEPYDDGSWWDFDSQDPEVIRAVLAVHQAIVENKAAIEENETYWDWWEESEPGYSVQTGGLCNFRVAYTMENGKTISRSYSVPVFTRDLNDPDSPTAKLDALVNLPEVVEKAYSLNDKSGEDLILVTLTNWSGTDSGGYEEEFAVGPKVEVSVSPKAYERVLEAVQADLKEGNLGRRYLLSDEERMNNCFFNDLTFTFYRENQGNSSSSDNQPATYTITVTLQTTAAHTLAVLEEAGVLNDPVQLITQAQRAMANNERSENGDSWAGIDLSDFIWATLGE